MTRLTPVLVMLTLVAVPQAADGQGQTLNFSYELSVRPEMASAFESAWKEHLSFREANGETWSFTVYQEVFGNTPGNYIVRSGSHSWADFDAYNAMDFQAALGNHLGATVGPLIQSFTASVDMTDQGLSRPADDLDAINVYALSLIHLDAEGIPAFEESLAAYHEAMVETDHPSRYVMIRPMFGGPAPAILLVGFSPDFAGLEEMDPTVEAAMIEHHGADRAQEIFEGLFGAVETIETRLLVRRPDLSFTAN